MKWDAEKTQKLIALYEHECDFREICRELGCDQSQASDKIFRLRKEGKILARKNCDWKPDEVERLHALRNKRISLCEIAFTLGRTREAVRDKLRRKDKMRGRNGLFINGEVFVSKISGREVSRVKISNGYLFKSQSKIWYSTNENGD